MGVVVITTEHAMCLRDSLHAAASLPRHWIDATNAYLFLAGQTVLRSTMRLSQRIGCSHTLSLVLGALKPGVKLQCLYCSAACSVCKLEECSCMCMCRQLTS